ncbi:MAG: putative endonuclease lcl3 [Candelina submexicana]|nr:MAG: putative endonuclease lcl3 [Candelina submexicana]
MRWPPWSSIPPSPPSKPSELDDPSPPPAPKPLISWSTSLNSTDWTHYTEPRTLIPTILLTSTALVFARIYRSYLRRIPEAANVEKAWFRKRSLFGYVTSVGDADNFRLFHTPGGRMTGWGWLPGRRIPKARAELRERTWRPHRASRRRPEYSTMSSTAKIYIVRQPQIHIRLAGIDAPELAHFGRPAQPYSSDALSFLTFFVLHRRVRAYVYRRDQYDRLVATVYVRRGLLRRDVGLQMVKKGLATVYEAKTGAEFGNLEGKYRRAEWWAKWWGRGMWRDKGGESPREYKTRMGKVELEKEKSEKK